MASRPTADEKTARDTPDEAATERTDPGTPRHTDGISPLNPETMPRAEDDARTRAASTDFNDVPDPGPNVGRTPGA